jgi:ABC-2 type transport system ATP-binding protein
MPILDVCDLHKSYGDLRAVAGVSFSIESGEVFGLLGPNGAGKSTTINIIATLLRADRGSISLDGASINNSSLYKRKIGYVPQEISLSDKLTARENLRLFGQLYDLFGAALRDRVEKNLAAVDLADRADDRVGTFSGGMKRRLNIAASLLHEPRLLLMDEPTAGVDPQARAYIFAIVERLAEQGCAVLYTTHYMEEAQRLCNRIAIIDHGRILAEGTHAQLVATARSKRSLLLTAPALSPVLVGQFAQRLGDVQWSLDGDTARIGITESDRIWSDAVRAAQELRIHPRALSIDEPNLEAVFLELTGRALRD